MWMDRFGSDSDQKTGGEHTLDRQGLSGGLLRQKTPMCWRIFRKAPWALIHVQSTLWLASPPRSWRDRLKSRYPAHGHPSKKIGILSIPTNSSPLQKLIDNVRLRHDSCKYPLKKALLRFSSSGLCSTLDAGHCCIGLRYVSHLLFPRPKARETSQAVRWAPSFLCFLWRSGLSTCRCAGVD
jgi:hypothetical protein